MKRPRIGIFDSTRQPSGVSRYVESLLAGINREEFEVVLFCRRGGPYASPNCDRQVWIPSEDVRQSDNAPNCNCAEVEAKGRSAIGTALRTYSRVAWRRLAPSFAKQWAGFAKDCSHLTCLLRQEPVDLLHIQMVNFDAAAVAARRAGIQHIVGTFHVDAAETAPRFWPLELASNHSLHAAIGVSGAAKRDWVGRTLLPSNRVRVVYNGINPDRFRRQVSAAAARRALNLPADALLIGAAGRLSRQKGYEYLLDAVAALAPNHPKLAVALAGDGPLRDSLSEQARQLGIADRLHFLGFRRDVQPLLDALDIFVIPSLWEALGYALLEAMATGLPAVGSDLGGLREVIVPGETGYLACAADADALAAALRPLLASAELRCRLGLAGRERVLRQFTEAEMLEQTIGQYRESLASRTCTGASNLPWAVHASSQATGSCEPVA